MSDVGSRGQRALMGAKALIIGAGGLFMVPSFAMLDSELAPEIERYFQAANIDTH